jgi:hypothetical protein
MANLDDLGHKSITDMDIDESLERIRQIRLSRNTVKESPRKPRTSAVKKIKQLPMPEISPELAAKLLAKLGGIK